MSEKRFLRRKGERNLLWIAANGKCQICGQDLGERWHADHIIPWSVSRQTNVHEMQALCPGCNLRKSDRMDGLFSGGFKPRSFQQEMANLCDGVVGNASVTKILAAVTPGGGKSCLPVIMAAKLIPSFADAICWVTPRRSLQEQAEEAFLDDKLCDYLGSKQQIRRSTNKENPCRDLAGYVTTMQALAADSGGINAFEMASKRYILVIDEAHHIEEGGCWHRAIQPLVDRAKLVLFMTGSLSRGDGKKIAFLPYFKLDSGDVVDTHRQTHNWPVLRYTRKDALRDESIIGMEFTLMDAEAVWTGRTGQPVSMESFDRAKEEGVSGDMLRSALETGFAYKILDRTLEHWSMWREQRNQRAKMLVVASDIFVAKMYLKHIRDAGYRAAIATSDETKEAEHNISRFRHGNLNILVTVAMAYEGLDVPAVTHIACLTHIRSYPWIEQMFARATRVDRELLKAGKAWSEQHAFAFVPDDPEMREIIGQIRQEQIEAAAEKGTPKGGSPREETLPQRDIIPHASAVIDERVDALDGDLPSKEESRVLRQAMQRNGILEPISKVSSFLKDIGWTAKTDAESCSPGPRGPLTTASQRESQLRNRIQKKCNRIDMQHGLAHGTANREVMIRFGKSRDLMTERELGEVWAWVQDYDASLCRRKTAGGSY